MSGYDGNLAALGRHYDVLDAATCPHCEKTGPGFLPDDCCPERVAEVEDEEMRAGRDEAEREDAADARREERSER